MNIPLMFSHWISGDCSGRCRPNNHRYSAKINRIFVFAKQFKVFFQKIVILQTA